MTLEELDNKVVAPMLERYRDNLLQSKVNFDRFRGRVNSLMRVFRSSEAYLPIKEFNYCALCLWHAVGGQVESGMYYSSYAKHGFGKAHLDWQDRVSKTATEVSEAKSITTREWLDREGRLLRSTPAGESLVAQPMNYVNANEYYANYSARRAGKTTAFKQYVEKMQSDDMTEATRYAISAINSGQPINWVGADLSELELRVIAANPLFAYPYGDIMAENNQPTKAYEVREYIYGQPTDSWNDEQLISKLQNLRAKIDGLKPLAKGNTRIAQMVTSLEEDYTNINTVLENRTEA